MDAGSREGILRTALSMPFPPQVAESQEDQKIDAGWTRSSALAVIDAVSNGTVEPRTAKR
jgi:hypothetical protein